MSNPNSPLLFDREIALNRANIVVEVIKDYCDDIIVCGGLRRELPQVHDIDIVAHPFDDWSMSIALGNTFPKLKSSKTKYEMFLDGIKCEIYLAKTQRQYEVLKLVRTGSFTFNRNLCQTANEKNMSLRYSYKEGLCGLYGAIWGYDAETKHKKLYVNPMRKIAYMENEVIMTVFDDSSYLEPKNRNLGFEEEYDNEI